MNNESMQKQWDSSFLFGGNAAYLENLYESYLEDPQSVEPHFADFFKKLGGEPISHETVRAHFRAVLQHPTQTTPVAQDDVITQLTQAYRTYGHQAVQLDPLALSQRPSLPQLSLSHYGLSETDLNLKATLDALRKTYANKIGYEYMHIADITQVNWLRERIEHAQNKIDKKALLKELIAADGLEKYLGRRFVGQKRFSLEGGDSLIPALNDMIQRGGAQGVKECIMGMAHRGRLNVLVNVVGKPLQQIADEFQGSHDEQQVTYSGDVKYHLGYSSDVQTTGGIVHLVLAFNPSHLEFVCPVVEGSVRARQSRRKDLTRSQVLPILIHGDAAFSGQGVVMETLNLSQTRGFTTGGTVHIIINNQVGFTMSNPLDARSTVYCSDIAKMIDAPIFHVNADDPEAVLFVSRLALDYRMQFHRDVVIDLVCYRRFGHQEVDEPTATQPLMYQKIKQHKEPYKIYADQLIAEGLITTEAVETLYHDIQADLEQSKTLPPIVNDVKDPFRVNWLPYLGQHWRVPTKTAVDQAILKRLAKKLEALPEGMTLQPQVKKMLDDRVKMTEGALPLNWGYAETLAYATLLAEGHPIRISGQDSQRGTFAHRHAVLHGFEDDRLHTPLLNLGDDQKANFTVIDSILSELAVVGFEYGFASSAPDTLVIWEAQFGDFANGAQVMIDQFISSAEQKWGRLCGLTMLLPHGYEGMGPEHSSARLERYLQLCAQDNMQVCVPTTPAQIFHLLRRQMLRPYRKPLIVMTPKSLLRHPLAISTLNDLSQGEYQLVIPDVDHIDPKIATRIVLCTGKVYYDLLSKQREQKQNTVALIRIEQLYPFPRDELRDLLAQYKAKDIIWCQEEPQNQGAWYQLQHHFVACLAKHQSLYYIGRESAAAPAGGSHHAHAAQQEKLVHEALGLK